MEICPAFVGWKLLFAAFCGFGVYGYGIFLQKLADSEKFHKAAFALAIEIILFSYNCSK